jgi:hypothetical protein
MAGLIEDSCIQGFHFGFIFPEDTVSGKKPVQIHNLLKKQKVIENINNIRKYSCNSKGFLSNKGMFKHEN